MNDNTDAKAPRTGSSTGGTMGADHVFYIFQLVETPLLTKLICISIIMLIFSCIGAFLVVPPLLVVSVLPFVPGIIVRREFKNDVIPACRSVCSEPEIVSGALKSLRFLWERYLLGLLPAIVIFLGLIVSYAQTPFGRTPFRELGWPISLSFAAVLLGEFPLAVFPVARLFSRRAGMIVMMILIILGQAILLVTALFGASGLLWFTDGTPAVKEYTVFTFRLISICTVFFVGGLGYFLHAAYTDAKNNGLLY